MKIVYDPEVDALSIIFRETTVTTKHLGEGIAADYDADGKLAGIEILDATMRFGGRDTLHQVVLEGVGLATQPKGHKSPKKKKEPVKGQL
jgi:uncharacterized protein YuzE